MQRGSVQETPEGCILDDDLFSGGRSRVKLTRSQRRAKKQLHQQEMRAGALDISAVELQMLQKEDLLDQLEGWSGRAAGNPLLPLRWTSLQEVDTQGV